MKWNFKKRIKIIPGVHLNLSKNGISTSIGGHGYTVNLGHVSYNDIKNKLASPTSTVESISLPEPIIENITSADNIFSADIQDITSQDMQGVKESILLARQQRLDLMKDLEQIKKDLSKSKKKKILSYILLYGLISKKYRQSINEDIQAQEQAIIEVTKKIEDSYVKIDIDFDAELKEKYDDLVYAFRRLCTSNKIWDITSAHAQNRAVTRSAASVSIERKSIKFNLKSLPEIKSNVEALYFENANGGDIYIYPTFIVMYLNNNQFGIIGIEELMLTDEYTLFIEDEFVPKDSEVVDKTWAKVNKDGSRDKRFEGNYQIPVVKYSKLSLDTLTGLREKYLISNVFATDKFTEAFMKYQVAIKMSL